MQAASENAVMHQAKFAAHIRTVVTAYLEQHPGKSVRQLAIDAGIAQSTLSRFMSGETKDLTLESVGMLAAEMGISVNELLGDGRSAGAYSSQHVATVLKAMENMPEETQALVANLATSLRTVKKSR